MLLILALSDGGSRAAFFSTAVLRAAFPPEAEERLARLERLSRANAGAKQTWDAASVKMLMKA